MLPLDHCDIVLYYSGLMQAMLLCSGTTQGSWLTGVSGTYQSTIATSMLTVLSSYISWSRGIRSTSPVIAGRLSGQSVYHSPCL